MKNEHTMISKSTYVTPVLYNRIAGFKEKVINTILSDIKKEHPELPSAFAYEITTFLDKSRGCTDSLLVTITVINNLKS